MRLRETATAMYDGDDWLAVDKLYHVLFGSVIVVFVSFVAMRSRYSFLRRRAIELGCVVSILGGAAKEAADEVGIFRSAGASGKDAAADLVGVGISWIFLLMWKRWGRAHALSQEKEMSMV